MTSLIRTCILCWLLMAICLTPRAKTDPIVSGTVRDVAGTTIEFAAIALHRAADSVVIKPEFSDAARTCRFAH